VQLYSQAIIGDPEDHKLLGNRSAAYLALGLYEEAAQDARKAAFMEPSWPKAYYRLGCALLGLSQCADAASTLNQGLRLEPGNADMAAKADEAGERAAAEVAARRAQAATERRGIVAQLRAARRKDAQQGMVNQFKQSMTGPEWEVEDLEWCACAAGHLSACHARLHLSGLVRHRHPPQCSLCRRPTFLPAMKLKPVSTGTALSSPHMRSLAGFLGALADLAGPKQALHILGDVPRLQVQACMSGSPTYNTGCACRAVFPAVLSHKWRCAGIPGRNRCGVASSA
jgi:hypothetical protein